jgi:hypothetical protein
MGRHDADPGRESSKGPAIGGKVEGLGFGGAHE